MGQDRYLKNAKLINKKYKTPSQYKKIIISHTVSKFYISKKHKKSQLLRKHRYSRLYLVSGNFWFLQCDLISRLFYFCLFHRRQPLLLWTFRQG